MRRGRQPEGPLVSGNNDRAKAAAYRQSEKGRMARKMYNMQPEVKARKAVKRAMKAHQTPPAIKPQ
jgi:hypothetical protein